MDLEKYVFAIKTCSGSLNIENLLRCLYLSTYNQFDPFLFVTAAAYSEKNFKSLGYLGISSFSMPHNKLLMVNTLFKDLDSDNNAKKLALIYIANTGFYHSDILQHICVNEKVLGLQGLVAKFAQSPLSSCINLDNKDFLLVKLQIIIDRWNEKKCSGSFRLMYRDCEYLQSVFLDTCGPHLRVKILQLFRIAVEALGTYNELQEYNNRWEIENDWKYFADSECDHNLQLLKNCTQHKSELTNNCDLFTNDFGTREPIYEYRNNKPATQDDNTWKIKYNSTAVFNSKEGLFDKREKLIGYDDENHFLSKHKQDKDLRESLIPLYKVKINKNSLKVNSSQKIVNIEKTLDVSKYSSKAVTSYDISRQKGIQALENKIRSKESHVCSPHTCCLVSEGIVFSKKFISALEAFITEQNTSTESLMVALECCEFLIAIKSNTTKTHTFIFKILESCNHYAQTIALRIIGKYKIMKDTAFHKILHDGLTTECHLHFFKSFININNLGTCYENLRHLKKTTFNKISCSKKANKIFDSLLEYLLEFGDYTAKRLLIKNYPRILYHRDISNILPKDEQNFLLEELYIDETIYQVPILYQILSQKNLSSKTLIVIANKHFLAFLSHPDIAIQTVFLESMVSFLANSGNMMRNYEFLTQKLSELKRSSCSKSGYKKLKELLKTYELLLTKKFTKVKDVFIWYESLFDADQFSKYVKIWSYRPIKLLENNEYCIVMDENLEDEHIFKIQCMDFETCEIDLELEVNEVIMCAHLDLSESIDHKENK